MALISFIGEGDSLHGCPTLKSCLTHLFRSHCLSSASRMWLVLPPKYIQKPALSTLLTLSGFSSHPHLWWACLISPSYQFIPFVLLRTDRGLLKLVMLSLTTSVACYLRLSKSQSFKHTLRLAWLFDLISYHMLLPFLCWPYLPCPLQMLLFLPLCFAHVKSPSGMFFLQIIILSLNILFILEDFQDLNNIISTGNPYTPCNVLNMSGIPRRATC